MRILFDTNVLVAALLTGGSCYDIIDHAIYDHEIFYTDFILEEFRDKFTNKFHFPNPTIERFTQFINRFFMKGNSSHLVEKVCRDPDDDQVLADAVANHIDLIITGDDDLLALKTHKGIRILRPRDYWKL